MECDGCRAAAGTLGPPFFFWGPGTPPQLSGGQQEGTHTHRSSAPSAALPGGRADCRGQRGGWPPGEEAALGSWGGGSCPLVLARVPVGARADDTTGTGLP